MCRTSKDVGGCRKAVPLKPSLSKVHLAYTRVPGKSDPPRSDRSTGALPGSPERASYDSPMRHPFGTE
jgi:hypothetical protein